MTKLADYMAALPIEEQLAVARETIEALRRELDQTGVKLVQTNGIIKDYRERLDDKGRELREAREQAEKLALSESRLVWAEINLRNECARLRSWGDDVLLIAREQQDAHVAANMELAAARAKLEEWREVLQFYADSPPDIYAERAIAALAQDKP